ncbi:TIGR03086 family metal-binding protein [Streptomyces sp. NPDC015220]|uniref:TIGR03086 family metal-binding protein n=1 Tax=Streptomyces sp. NPDC015220 TaxID=3364947 RepID=UPI0036FE9A4E
MDILKLDRTAALETVRLLEHATPEDWTRPTPCAGWTLHDLVAHLAGRHHGFAAAAAGGGAARGVWLPPALGGDPVAAYRSATAAVLDAFARPGVLTREFSLPEISTGTRFPATVAIGYHFLDLVVHGWDVARTLGIPLELDLATTEAALLFALRVPDDERRLEPAPAFRPALPAATHASPLDLALAALGRSPAWSAPASL